MTSLRFLCPIFIIFITSGNALDLSKTRFVLQIIHNNDMHSKFEQTNASYEACSEEEAAEKKCYGGFARTKTAINQAFKDAERENIPSILVNSGDFFVGSSHYQLKKWEVVAPMVNALNFSVIALGNHEFDDGIECLINYINNVNAPVVCCNLELETEPRLKNLPNLKPSHVLEINGTKIGVIGSLTPLTMEYEHLRNLKILPEIPSVQAEAKRLKADGVNIIILLSHSEFEEDKTLIAPAIPELSLIVGSHSHTLLHNPTDKTPDIETVEAPYPYFVEHPSGKVIPLIQAYAFTKYLGKLIVTFDSNGNVIREMTHGNTILLDASIPEDPEVKEFADKLIAPFQAEIKSPIAYTRVPLKPADFRKRQFESTLANLVTDAILDYISRSQLSEMDFGFHSVDKYRYLFPRSWKGRVSLEDMVDAFRSGNLISEATYAGSVIKEALEYSMIAKENESKFPNFLHFAGLRAVYNLSKPINNRVESIEVLCVDCIVPQYENLKVDQDYRVLLPRFLRDGHQGFQMLRDEAKDAFNILGIDVKDIVEDYLATRKIIYPTWDGRVTMVKNKESLV